MTILISDLRIYRRTRVLIREHGRDAICPSYVSGKQSVKIEEMSTLVVFLARESAAAIATAASPLGGGWTAP